jgi:hypothetical protein
MFSIVRLTVRLETENTRRPFGRPPLQRCRFVTWLPTASPAVPAPLSMSQKNLVEKSIAGYAQTG